MERLTITIAASWAVGTERDALFPTLTRTDNVECGFLRQEVAGTKADFEAALHVAEVEYIGADRARRSSLTAVIKRFRQVIRYA